jgi:type VI secretion system protein ImpA
MDIFRLPVPGAVPAGIDLRNDPRFHALERALAPAARSARLATPDTDPAVDWEAVLRDCEDLAAEGRDLRLLVLVARALANRDGFAGAAEGLALLADTVETAWDTLHPELRERASPREAAVRRINALHQIENDEDGLLCDLAHREVVTLRVLGRLTGADLAAGSITRAAFEAEMARGLGPAESAALLAQAEARADRARTAIRALAAEEPERLAALASAVAATRAALSRLEDSLSARIGEDGAGIRFLRLGRFLERVAQTLDRPAAPAEAVPAETAAQPAALPGAIASRADVERMLDRIIEFYEATEPASPIPILARRMRRLVPMSFLQLMEELAPGGLKEIRTLAGADGDKKRQES